jgi:hypothetical protein
MNPTNSFEVKEKAGRFGKGGLMESIIEIEIVEIEQDIEAHPDHHDHHDHHHGY